MRRIYVSASLVTLTSLLSCGQQTQNAAVQTGEYSLTALGERASVTSAAPYTAKRVTSATPPERANLARVRVSFIGDEANLPTIGVRQVFLCGQGCVALGSSKAVKALGDDSGEGDLFADVAMNSMSIDRIIVQPDPSAGAVVAFKTIKLQKPVMFAANGRHEVFLTVKRVGRGASTHLQAEFLGTQQLPPSVTSVVAYRPDRALRTNGRSPVTLELAPGHLKAAQLMGLEPLDTGGVAPRFNVWPALATAQPVKIRMKVDTSRIAKGLTLDDYHVRLGDGQRVPVSVDGGHLTFTARSVGWAEVKTSRRIIETDTGERFALPDPPAALGGQTLTAQDATTCKNRLIASRSTYESYLQQYRMVRVFECEDVSPFMHIVLVNRSNRTATVGIPITPSVDYPGSYVLRPISSHGQGYAVALNGFYWTGDRGTYVGTGYGQPAATLITNGTRRKVTATNEAILGFQMQPVDQSRGTSAEFFTGASQTLNFNTHGYNAIGSTTSVINSSKVCNPNLGTTVDLWSAAGIGLNRMALVSSVSAKYASSRELCAVFEGLGYLDGAIRMDGGASTSMWWNGSHINPLADNEYYLFGAARDVLNALAWR